MTKTQAKMLQEFVSMLNIQSKNELHNNYDGAEFERLQTRKNQVIAELNRNGYSDK